jgi:hypothetical protein
MTTMTKRMAPFCGTIALLAQVLAFQGCGGSNSGTTGTGGSSATGTGGTSASTGGTTGTGGTSTSTGGTTGTGGASTGGTTGTGGTTTATGGAGGAATSGFGQPACGNTAAGTAIAKGVTCSAADATPGTATALCYKTCGPEKQGVKSETCPAGGGTYAEMSGCTFDSTKDYSCYKIPTTPDATCPTTPLVSGMTAAIQAGQPCSIPDCVVCGGTTGYLDSTMAMKTGYCVCQAGATTPTWSCASSTAWPCPTGLGC